MLKTKNATYRCCGERSPLRCDCLSGRGATVSFTPWLDQAGPGATIKMCYKRRFFVTFLPPTGQKSKNIYLYMFKTKISLSPMPQTLDPLLYRLHNEVLFPRNPWRKYTANHLKYIGRRFSKKNNTILYNHNPAFGDCLSLSRRLQRKAVKKKPLAGELTRAAAKHFMYTTAADTDSYSPPVYGRGALKCPRALLHTVTPAGITPICHAGSIMTMNELYPGVRVRTKGWR